jgi:hypothetical protein
MNATLTELHGGNAASWLQVLNNRHLDPIYGNTIQRLAGIGVHQPDSVVLLEAAQRILEQRLDSLTGLKTKSQAVTQRMLDDFNSPSYAGSGSASLSANQRAEAAITHQHNLTVILSSQGIGTPEERMAGYIHSNPEAAQALYTAGIGNQVIKKVEVAYKELTRSQLVAKQTEEIGKGLDASSFALANAMITARAYTPGILDSDIAGLSVHYAAMAPDEMHSNFTATQQWYAGSGLRNGVQYNGAMGRILGIVV